MSKPFFTVIPHMQQRPAEPGSSPDSVTIIYDKANVSKTFRALVDAAGLYHVSALTFVCQQKLVKFANPRLETVLVDGEPVRAYRARHSIWGKQRTVVVLVSELLLEGQSRGCSSVPCLRPEVADPIRGRSGARTTNTGSRTYPARY